eukprot:Phypoly_transcript_15326.p1 GENE.Phypoly_transcript_15326~~Phypoly_transcript_15326.p1  ORF type:complete len:235 (+),score=20.97 Phypoly_transcript_15326:112-816(+)
MPPVKYDELQVEEAPNYNRNYKRLGIIAGAIILGCVVVVVLAVTVPSSKANGPSDVPYLAYSNTTEARAGPKDGIPCIEGSTNRPANCVQRFVPCGTSDLSDAKALIGPATDHACKQTRVYVGEIYVVQFYNNKRECIEIKMEMGECWGPQPNNPGSIYSCQGKCGAGCGNINCGAWARDCLRHDVCSWYYTATGGSKDAHCGESYDLASDDFWGNCDCNGSGGKDKSLTNMCP